MEKKELKEEDVVLCTVDKIVGTTVFVNIEGNGQGSIIVSEIAPGRIRNLRDYVVPHKKIVCKILKVGENYVNLSLRRVTLKEKKEVLDKYEREKSSLSILKSVLKEKADSVAEKIKEESSLHDFLQNCRINPKQLEMHFTKEEAEKICKIVSEKKEKEITAKKEFKLKSEHADGIIKIKKILSMPADKNADIKYIAAGRFNLSVIGKNFKDANFKINTLLEEIKMRAKQSGCEFSVKEK